MDETNLEVTNNSNIKEFTIIHLSAVPGLFLPSKQTNKLKKTNLTKGKKNSTKKNKKNQNQNKTKPNKKTPQLFQEA